MRSATNCSSDISADAVAMFASPTRPDQLPSIAMLHGVGQDEIRLLSLEQKLVAGRVTCIPTQEAVRPKDPA
jgi:hypothetical protein